LKIASLSLSVTVVAFFLPVLASADTFDWGFINTANDIDGWGTMTANLSSTPGVYDIISGSGTIDDLGVAYAVTIVPCPSQPTNCEVSNTDNHGANLTFDDLLYINNPPASQLDNAYGILLTPGPQGANDIGIWGSEGGGSPGFFFGYNDNYTDGNGNGMDLPFSITPESNSFTLLGLGLGILAFVCWRKRKQNQVTL
jgi:hypothetical protein